MEEQPMRRLWQLALHVISFVFPWGSFVEPPEAVLTTLRANTEKETQNEEAHEILKGEDHFKHKNLSY